MTIDTNGRVGTDTNETYSPRRTKYFPNNTTLAMTVFSAGGQNVNVAFKRT
jgi:hypothetical protein